ncbi:hypothetical protein Lal_00017085 [Lupinus albus]|nr:hypothetical protein Lal_00017085 [Lupinus albus]
MAETPWSRRETAPSSRLCRPPFLMAAVVYTTRKPEAIFEAPSTLEVKIDTHYQVDDQAVVQGLFHRAVFICLCIISLTS